MVQPPIMACRRKGRPACFLVPLSIDRAVLPCRALMMKFLCSEPLILHPAHCIQDFM